MKTLEEFMENKNTNVRPFHHGTTFYELYLLEVSNLNTWFMSSSEELKEQEMRRVIINGRGDNLNST